MKSVILHNYHGNHCNCFVDVTVYNCFSYILVASFRENWSIGWKLQRFEKYLTIISNFNLNFIYVYFCKFLEKIERTSQSVVMCYKYLKSRLNKKRQNKHNSFIHPCFSSIHCYLCKFLIFIREKFHASIPHTIIQTPKQYFFFWYIVK